MDSQCAFLSTTPVWVAVKGLSSVQHTELLFLGAYPDVSLADARQGAAAAGEQLRAEYQDAQFVYAGGPHPAETWSSSCCRQKPHARRRLPILLES